MLEFRVKQRRHMQFKEIYSLSATTTSAGQKKIFIILNVKS